MFQYNTKGVCSRTINFDIKDNKITEINFVGGCEGNLKAISKLLVGMDIDSVIETLGGNTCGGRDTSCTDQLTKALVEYKSQAEAAI